MYKKPQDGLLIILSSPSGAGKSTLAKQLAKWDSSIRVSISATTRPARDNEQEGKDYFFLTEEKFKNKINNREFLEYATVFGNLYGTPVNYIE
ncbi:MAG: guanylate kinase, partial [Rhodobacteraceae bacterium]|nr:guanylate kinase [Paracoccaceae bacterium]